MQNSLRTDPNGNCIFFERAVWSLIEEPEICDLCAYFQDETGTCCCAGRIESLRAEREL